MKDNLDKIRKALRKGAEAVTQMMEWDNKNVFTKTLAGKEEKKSEF